MNVLSLSKQSSNKQPKAEQNLRGGHLTKRQMTAAEAAPLWLLLSFEILFNSVLLVLLLLMMIADSADVTER